jgi:hypothetical protein
MTSVQEREGCPSTSHRTPSAASERSILQAALAALLSAGCTLFLSAAAYAQVQAQAPPPAPPPPYAPIKPFPVGDLLLSLPTSHMPSAGTWEIRFSHRFNQSIDQGSFSDRVHSLWGLDSNADVGIGLSYALRRDLQLSFLRSNAMDDIELAAKYLVVQQAPSIPFGAAIRLGGDVRTEKDLNDRTSVFAQAILSHQFGQRAEVFVMPTYITNAGRAVSGQVSTALFKHAFNAPVGAAIAIRPALSIVAELVPKNRDLPSGTHADFGWSFGLKKAMGGHFFEIFLTDNNATHADQYVTATYQGSPLNRRDLHIGFNIERRFLRH